MNILYFIVYSIVHVYAWAVTILGVFVRNPLLAFLPAITFLAAGIHMRLTRRVNTNLSFFVVLTSGIFWFVYACYELNKQSLPDTSNPVDLRGDLFLIYPLLLLFSLMSVKMYWNALNMNQQFQSIKN